MNQSIERIVEEFDEMPYVKQGKLDYHAAWIKVWLRSTLTTYRNAVLDEVLEVLPEKLPTHDKFNDGHNCCQKEAIQAITNLKQGRED